MRSKLDFGYTGCDLLSGWKILSRWPATWNPPSSFSSLPFSLLLVFWAQGYRQAYLSIPIAPGTSENSISVSKEQPNRRRRVLSSSPPQPPASLYDVDIPTIYTLLTRWDNLHFTRLHALVIDELFLKPPPRKSPQLRGFFQNSFFFVRLLELFCIKEKKNRKKILVAMKHNRRAGAIYFSTVHRWRMDLTKEKKILSAIMDTPLKSNGRLNFFWSGTKMVNSFGTIVWIKKRIIWYVLQLYAPWWTVKRITLTLDDIASFLFGCVFSLVSLFFRVNTWKW